MRASIFCVHAFTFSLAFNMASGNEVLCFHLIWTFLGDSFCYILNFNYHLKEVDTNQTVKYFNGFLHYYSGIFRELLIIGGVAARDQLSVLDNGVSRSFHF